MEENKQLSNKAQEFLELQSNSIKIINELGEKIQELSKNLCEFKKYGDLTITLDELLSSAKDVSVFTKKISESKKEIENIKLVGVKLIEADIKYDSILKDLVMWNQKLEEITSASMGIKFGEVQKAVAQILTTLRHTEELVSSEIISPVSQIKSISDKVNENIQTIEQKLDNNTRDIQELKDMINSQNTLFHEWLGQTKTKE